MNSYTISFTFSSQLVSETKTFSDIANQSFTLGYAYDLSGGLQSVTDPFGSTINYARDKIGRLTGVSGTPFGDNTTGQYLEGIQYRAFGAVKQMTYKTDDNNLISMQYDNDLRVSNHQTSSAQSNAVEGFAQKAAFTYLADSRVQAMDNRVNSKFDRAFAYDFAGRLTRNDFGNGQGTTAYTQSIQYNDFSQMTLRDTTHWGAENAFLETFVNGRQTNGNGLLYDAAGNLLHTQTRGTDGSYQQTIYDAATRATTVKTQSYERVARGHTIRHVHTLEQSYDGDGRAVKAQETWQAYDPTAPPDSPKYQIWSTVLGSPLTEISDTGAKLKTKVFAEGAVIAEQIGANAQVAWIAADPVTGSSLRIYKTGMFFEDERKELEALGQEVLPEEPPVEEQQSSNENVIHTAEEPEWQCQAAELGEKSFFEQPEHCQRAQMESSSFPLSELFSARMTESNPQRINAAGGAGRKPPTLVAAQLTKAERQARKVLGDALAATGKFDNEADGESGGLGGDAPGFVGAGIQTQENNLPHGRFSLIVYFKGDVELDGDILDKIDDAIDYAIKSDECTKAFKKVGATPIKDQLANTTLVTESVFNDANNDHLWTTEGPGIGEFIRSKYTTTLYDISVYNYQNKGRNYIGLTYNALGSPSGIREDFGVVLIHSMVHTGSIEGQKTEGESGGIRSAPYHDLKFLGEDYKNILRSCTKRGGSKLLEGQ